MSKQSEQEILFKWAVASRNADKLNAMLTVAQSEPEIYANINNFDADPYLLNCLNGTLDLRTGYFREHKREDLCSKIIPVEFNPHAEFPVWQAFLERVTGGNRELISYLQRAAGYSLTGKVGEHVLFFLFGTGRNGKSVFIETMQALMGDYACAMNIDSLVVKKFGQGIPNDIARLAGSRYVSTSETSEGQRLDESRIKDLTGGDKITARYLHKEFFDFYPQFKLWIRGNHKPQIRGTDDAIWERIHLIPFTVQIPKEERDKELIIKLRRELSGILNWAVAGCLEWQKFGLNPPEEVCHAVKDYREQMDVLGEFIADSCVTVSNCDFVKERCRGGCKYKISAGALYEAYEKWAKKSGQIIVPKKAFGMSMTERGVQRDKTRDGHLYVGIFLKESEDDAKTVTCDVS
ncbi:MAG: phage/plasmid primase, P4 family [Nitrospiraceae bacterium]|nr:phage/plasmid primase, P4 family [Nitrospiraceae bacterium]